MNFAPRQQRTFAGPCVRSGRRRSPGSRPEARNSWVSLRSISRSRLRSAETTAAPLISAISATAKRPRLPRNNLQRRRQNITRPADTGAGFKRAARHIGIMLPIIATTAASPRTAGKKNQAEAGPASQRRWCPALAQTPAPSTKPIAPPATASINCSARKIPATTALVAPIAFMMPTSARRSSTVAADVAATASAAAISAAKRNDPKQRAHVRQDFSFGIGHAANGANVRTRQNLRDLIADRRNVGRAEPVVVFFGRQRCGSRNGERIGGLRQRADEKLRNCPGWPESFCAIVSGTSTASSSAASASPVERIPVTTRGNGFAAEVALRFARPRKSSGPGRFLRDNLRRKRRRQQLRSRLS